MKNGTVNKWIAAASVAAVVAAMLKAAAKAKSLNDYFPQKSFIDATALSRSDDPAALGYFLGCVADSLGCADMAGLGCGDPSALGCAMDGLGFNMFNAPHLIRQSFEGGRNKVSNGPARGLTSGRGASGHDINGEPTRSRPTGTLSLNHAYMAPLVHQWSKRGGLGGFDADGLGFSLKKSIKKVTHKISSDLKKVAAPVRKVTAKVQSDIKKVATLVKKDIAKVATQAKRDLKHVVAPVKRDFGNALTLLRTKDPLFKKIAPIKPTAVESSASGAVHYYDQNGAEISEDQFNQQNADAEAFNQMMAEMTASAPGEVQFEESTGLYWSQDASGAWFQYDPASKSWNPDSGTLATDPYQSPGIMPGEDSNAYDDSQASADAAQPGDSLPPGVFYDAATQLYWTQDETGAWWYFDEGTGQFIQEAPEPTASSPAALASQYTPDDDAEQAYIDQITAQEAGQDLDGNRQQAQAQGIVQDVNGVYWSQDPDGTWYWWSEDVQAWQLDEPMKPTVVEQETGTGGGFFKWLFNWGKGGLGHLTSRETGNRLFVIRQLGDYVDSVPLKADRDGKVYADIGGSLGCLGCVDDLAGAEGLGFKLFGRTWGEARKNVDTIAKDIAAHATPSGALYKYVKEKQPKLFREYRREAKTATPYILIAGGTVLTVATLGAGSAAGAAAIAGGVAELGAQGYKDYSAHETAKDVEKAQHALDEQVALEAAGSSAVREDQTIPFFSADWWMGDVDPDQTSLLTVGEQT